MQHDNQFLPRLSWIALHFNILAVSGVLLGALYAQFVVGEFACPLCMIERMAMILALMGPISILLAARTARIDAATFASGYGMSVLSAVLGAAVSERQLALHLANGDIGYGAPFAGLHLYSWALVVFLVVALMSAVNLIFAKQLTPTAARFGVPSKICVWLVCAIIAANAVGVFIEAGLHPFLPDTPTCNQLFGDLGWK